MHSFKPIRSLLVMAALTTTFVLRAAALPTDPFGGTGGGAIAGSLHVRVVHGDTGLPFPGALVMVGPRPDEPFAGNWGFTSVTGEIDFSNPALQGPVTVTAGAAGHAYFTLVLVNANDLVLPLRVTIADQTTFSVGDYVSGIDVNNGSFHYGDGYVDMALVIPALRLESLMTFDMSKMMGPPEIINILGQSFEIPSNIFLPQQWELFTEITKDHYYLYLQPGDYTLTAISGRMPLDALLNSTDITQLIPLTQWREIDKLDLTVSGDTNGADLNVDPDLSPTVTLNLANIPENSVAWCFSLADLDNLQGLGRLIPLGLNSLSCPAGSQPCGGTVNLTTTPAVGEFSGMAYLPAVVVQQTGTDKTLMLVNRGPHGQSYTEDMSTFFRYVDLTQDLGTFSYSNAEDPASGSPPVDVHTARITGTANGEIYWEFMIPGPVLDFVTPGLPASAPSGPEPGTTYRWEQASFGLTYNLPSFDFNNFAFSDLAAHGSHISSDNLDFAWYGDPAGVPARAMAAGSLRLSAGPNPFEDQTTIRFELAVPGAADLSIYTSDGRKVASLERLGLSAGQHQLVWRGLGAAGAPLPSGVYLARLAAGRQSESLRLVIRR